MPVLTNCTFTYNDNSNEIGGGAIGLYDLYTYGELPVILTVEDCTFAYNTGGASSAIYWEGVSLFMSNTIVR